MRNLIDNLHIRLSASDMNLSASREYYAAVEEDHNFEISQDDGTHTIADVVLVKDEGNTYTCSGNIKINMNVDEGSMGSVLEPDDLILNIADNEDVINLKGEQLGIKQELDLSEISNTGTKEYPFTFEISHEDNEEIKIYVKFNNKTTAQNYLSGKELNMSVIVEDLSCNIKDQIAPEIEDFTIKGKEESPFTLTSGYTHKKDVTYTLSWTDEDVVSYCIKESGSCTNEEFKSTEGNSVTVSEPLLSSGDGRKTINAYIKDETGNISKVKTEKITLDETNPSVEILQNSVTTDSITVTIKGTDTNGVVTRQCRIEEDSYWNDAYLVDGEYQCTIYWLDDDTQYNVEVRTIDTSGRISEIQSTNITTDIDCDNYDYTGNALGLLNAKCRPGGLSEDELGDMYRFVGSCNANSAWKNCDGVVDNFVCFGYDNENIDCKQGASSDYMFRIIGITPEGQLKLIKNTAIREGESENEKTYRWWEDDKTDINWPKSEIFLRLNGMMNGETPGLEGDTNLFIDSKTSNVTYIKSSGDTTWYNKIEQNHSWWYGDIFSVYNVIAPGEGANQTADRIYQIETGQLAIQQNKNEGDVVWPANQKVEAAVGLMYISDYYYSYAESGTNSSSTNCYSGFSESKCLGSWLNIFKNGSGEGSEYEWTMIRSGKDSSSTGIWRIENRGGVYPSPPTDGWRIRPVFFLTLEASQIDGGSGRKSKPYIIVK